MNTNHTRPRCRHVASLDVGERGVAQTPAGLDLRLSAGLSVTGAVGAVYQIQYVTYLTQTNNPTTWREWRCLTDPTKALSALGLLSASPAGPNVTVSWQSVSGVNHCLERSTDSWGNSSFMLLAPNLPGQPDTTAYTDTTAANLTPQFYRVGVED